MGGGSEWSRRDALGRIVALTERLAGESHTYEYRYHPRGWLTEVRRDGAPLETFVYDANGNRTSVTRPDGTLSATYDERDRILTHGPNRYELNEDGELVRKITPTGTIEYTYDTAGALRTVGLADGTKLEYIVDGLGRRIAKKKNGTLVQGLLYRDERRVVAELDGSGKIVSRFVYASRDHVPDQMIKGGVLYRLVSDSRGSVRLVVDTETGEVTQALDYDSFGQVTRDSNPGFQRFGYAGGLYDSDTRLVRFGARDYDSELGRWTVRDPILSTAANRTSSPTSKTTPSTSSIRAASR